MDTLLRTPQPYPTESMQGYLLRVVETNGYESPQSILKFSGVTTGEKSAGRIPVAHIERVLGFTHNELHGISNAGPLRHGVPEVAILGHTSGSTHRNGFFRTIDPEFCPTCVMEQGHLDACWDLAWMAACPVHHCRLLSVCPVCGDRIRWFRPGLLRCHCNADLSTARLPAVDDAVAELMGLLWAKVHRQALHDVPNTLGYPVDALEQLTLARLVFMMRRLSQHHLSSLALPADSSSFAVATNTAEVLRDWLRGFHAFLRRVGDQSRALGLNVVGINERFKHFYRDVFKCYGYSGEFDFLRDKYTRFGLTE